MRRALLATLLLLGFALSPLALPAARAEFRLFVYCDYDSCPGVAGGKRSDACNAGGVAGPCFYSNENGIGAGVYVAPDVVCDDPCCLDARLDGRCVRLATNVVTIACGFMLPFSVYDVTCAVFPDPEMNPFYICY